MPGPPPYGRSSTVRCTSLVCARGSSVPTFNRPRSIARPTIPYSKAPVIIPGNSVTTSILISVAPAVCARLQRLPRGAGCSSKLRRPVHQNHARRKLDLREVPGNSGYPVLALTLHHHHRTCRAVQEVSHFAKLRAFQVPYQQSDQVRLVILALTCRWQLGAIHLDHSACQRRRSVAILDTFEPRHEPLSVGTP